MLTMTHTYEKDINVTRRDKKICWHLLSEKPCERNKKLFSYGQECFKCKRKKTPKICKGKHKEQDVNECFTLEGQ